MMLVLTLFAMIAMIAVFAMTTGVVAPVLAMFTGCFVGPIQSAFFLSPLIPSAFFARLILAAIIVTILMIGLIFIFAAVFAFVFALVPGFILAFPFLPFSGVFLILSFPFYLRCRSGCRCLRGWCRSLRQGIGGSQEYDSCYKR